MRSSQIMATSEGTNAGNKRNKGHFRRHSFTTKHSHRKQHALQHHSYLLSLQKNQFLQPRYDIFSQNNHNNLIVHIPKNKVCEDLKPKGESFLVKKLQQKIRGIQKDKNKTSESHKLSELKGITRSSFYTKQQSYRSQQLNTMNNANQYWGQLASSQIKADNNLKPSSRPISNQQPISSQSIESSNNASLQQPIIVYGQQEDKAASMEQKLKFMYLRNRHFARQSWRIHQQINHSGIYPNMEQKRSIDSNSNPKYSLHLKYNDNGSSQANSFLIQNRIKNIEPNKLSLRQLC